MSTTFDSFFIRGTSFSGHRLHWNGEKFTDQGAAWSYESESYAARDVIDHDGMERIGLYGVPEEGGAVVLIKNLTA